MYLLNTREMAGTEQDIWASCTLKLEPPQIVKRAQLVLAAISLSEGDVCDDTILEASGDLHVNTVDEGPSCARRRVGRPQPAREVCRSAWDDKYEHSKRCLNRLMERCISRAASLVPGSLYIPRCRVHKKHPRFMLDSEDEDEDVDEVESATLMDVPDLITSEMQDAVSEWAAVIRELAAGCTGLLERGPQALIMREDAESAGEKMHLKFPPP
ncbi:hypothetical protein CEUSTIGMA_g369.t1 [Chlamydomonas eustigma]|uniref:Uncharacterized protein n=1 Tax=Chlamydomonas eustigma TaxID=1157962 RepID=A0A250WPY4_9CHLO|nr:hypothetical protein CEUSTIGMA_g369.t1 [Chlamydomonas eustigma]|eukprot:GAX72914.1 hypothetical protein CEUSTIGMA_g369.t1 [Chlamydomonas eustigma]